MPFLKAIEKYQPLWRDWDQKAQKEGLHATFYMTNKDEFVGEWHDNKKDGKGVYKWHANGQIYEGEWKNDMRNGFGNLSVKLPDGSFKKIYSGGWKNDKQNGYGAYYYSETHFYEGEWYAGKKSGWGRMYYDNGDIYEGEWQDDMRSGQGMLRLTNNNRYEGEWKRDKKNGNGKFFFLNKGNLIEGFWVDDVCKASQVIDFDREHAIDPTKYKLPALKLKDADQILEESVKRFNSK